MTVSESDEWTGAPVGDLPTYPNDFRRALDIAQRIDIIPTIVHVLGGDRPGPKRVLNWHALFVASILAIMLSKGKAHMSITASIFEGFTPSQRHELGLPGVITNYAQIESGLSSLVAGLQEDTVDEETGEVTPAELTAASIANSIIRASLPPQLRYSGEYAIDSTDFETDATRRSRATLINADEVSDTETVTEVSDGKKVRGTQHRTRGGRILSFPIAAADGRWQHSLDPDARDGFRSGKQMNHKDIFHGYDLHIAVPIPAMGDDAIPGLAGAPAAHLQGRWPLDRTSDGTDDVA